MDSRDRILNKLRAARPPFEDVSPAPETYLPVTRLAEGEDLLGRFRAELERLGVRLHIAESDDAAIQAIFTILETIQSDGTISGPVNRVMAWRDLPLVGLTDALTAREIEVIVPQPKGEAHFEALNALDPIRVGITGADAAIATTGTLVLVTREGQGRLPSLLPAVHIALLRKERLYARPENWLTGEGRRALAESRSTIFVTGPSRTGDIEMQIVLGVHGPRQVHVVLC